MLLHFATLLYLKEPRLARRTKVQMSICFGGLSDAGVVQLLKQEYHPWLFITVEP